MDQGSELALWRGRAEQQARRADQLAGSLGEIAELAGQFDSRTFEVANDDRLWCEDLDCGRRGWPEDGFHTVEDTEAGRLSFCPDHWEATP